MIHLNGSLVDPAVLGFDPRDRGLTLGDGVFETVKAAGGSVPLLPRHVQRMKNGAGVLAIPFDADVGAIEAAIRETLGANGLRDGVAAVRITLTRGVGPRGLVPPDEPQPTLIITATAFDDSVAPPATAVISAVRRNESSPLANVKSLNYLDNVMARQEAANAGADDAVMLNAAGALACASAANLFLVSSGAILTPAVADGVLPGITRALVLEAASDLGVPAAETTLEPDALARSDEAFLTSSLIGVRPLIRVNDMQVGDGTPGPVTERLRLAVAGRMA